MKFASLLFTFIASFNLWAIDCESNKILKTYTPRYAQYFKIVYYGQFKIIESGKKPNIDRFIVSDKPLDCTSSLFRFTSETKRFVATSTTHVSFLSDQGIEDRLVGFQGTHYLFNEKLQKQKIKNIHYQMNPEELLSLSPDLVMAYSANLGGDKRMQELRKLKIPIVLNHDFEEKHPLARAEWSVFSAAFFNKDDLQQELFTKIERSYNEYKRQAAVLKKKQVLVGDIQNGKWSTCGGESDLAILIRDAGGELVLKSKSHETQQVSLEKVLKIESKIDTWLTQNTWENLSVATNDSRYKKFSGIPAYNNNRKLNKKGFNDFWESGVGRPDLLLADLFEILHPESKHNLIWYKELK